MGFRRPGLVAGSVFLVIWGLTTHGKYSVAGDEPHYLIMTESLWSDADLDLQDEYRSGVSRRFGHPNLVMGDHARPDRTGSLRSVHDVGLPTLLVPIYGLAVTVSRVLPATWLEVIKQPPGLFAYSVMSLSMLALVCLGLGALTHALTPMAAPFPAILVVVAVGLSPPLLSNAFLLFPEGLGLVVVCATLWVAYATRPIGMAPLLVVTTALGLLPWAHRKFSLLALGLLLVLLVRQRDSLRQRSTRQLGVLVGVFVGPQLVLAGWTTYVWGHPGGPLMMNALPFGWEAFRAGVFGLLVDRENGLFVWAPIYLLLPAAWWLAPRQALVLLVPTGLLFVPAAAHHLWWGGFSPAARFLVPLVPLFALVIAHAVRSRRFALVWCALLIPQLLVSAYGWQHPRRLWPQGTGQNVVLEALPAIGPSVAALLPSLRSATPEVGLAVLWLGGIALANVLLVTVCRPAHNH